jgi:hypothetical protein
VQPGSDPQKKIAALAGMANAARVATAASLQPEAANLHSNDGRASISYPAPISGKASSRSNR